MNVAPAALMSLGEGAGKIETVDDAASAVGIDEKPQAEAFHAVPERWRWRRQVCRVQENAATLFDLGQGGNIRPDKEMGLNTGGLCEGRLRNWRAAKKTLSL